MNVCYVLCVCGVCKLSHMLILLTLGCTTETIPLLYRWLRGADETFSKYAALMLAEMRGLTIEFASKIVGFLSEHDDLSRYRASKVIFVS